MVVSVDLAYKNYNDLGIALLGRELGNIQINFVKARKLGLTGDPDAKTLAKALLNLCHLNNAQVILIDGPQAWKDPANGFEHSRVCEKILNTPAKTGLPGLVKPKNYTNLRPLRNKGLK